MALISSKGMYGLSAMYELSKHEMGTKFTASEISASTNIPSGYLEQLLGKLKKAGFVDSIRGAGGGYKLIVEPINIKIYDIIIALEGQIRVIDDCNSDILNLFFNDIKSSIGDSLALSLGDLGKYQNRYNDTLHYDI